MNGLVHRKIVAYYVSINCIHSLISLCACAVCTHQLFLKKILEKSLLIYFQCNLKIMCLQPRKSCTLVEYYKKKNLRKKKKKSFLCLEINNKMSITLFSHTGTVERNSLSKCYVSNSRLNDSGLKSSPFY